MSGTGFKPNFSQNSECAFYFCASSCEFVFVNLLQNYAKQYIQKTYCIAPVFHSVVMMMMMMMMMMMNCLSV